MSSNILVRAHVATVDDQRRLHLGAVLTPDSPRVERTEYTDPTQRLDHAHILVVGDNINYTLMIAFDAEGTVQTVRLKDAGNAIDVQYSHTPTTMTIRTEQDSEARQRIAHRLAIKTNDAATDLAEAFAEDDDTAEEPEDDDEGDTAEDDYDEEYLASFVTFVDEEEYPFDTEL